MYLLPAFASGNDVRLLRNGEETYPAMLEAIASARHHVHCEVFIISDDAIGRQFADAFAERARAGVEVRIVYDAVGCLQTPEAFFTTLTASGAQVVAYHPVAPWRRNWGLSRRDHRKILVIDGRVGFAGGLNFDLCHASESQGGGGWRDTHARIEGPAVPELGRHFLETWLTHAPPEMRPARDAIATYLERSPDAGSMDVQVVANRVKQGGSPIRRAYIDALQSARRSVWVTNPYFLPDTRIIKALVSARRRGVDVRVLLPERSDVPIIDLAARPIIRHLLHRGVRVYLWQKSILHAKTMVVDRAWTSVGSFNIDPASFNNLELNLNVRNDAFAEKAADMFLDDVRQSGELVPTRVDRSPAHMRVAETVLHGMRHWL